MVVPSHLHHHLRICDPLVCTITDMVDFPEMWSHDIHDLLMQNYQSMVVAWRDIDMSMIIIIRSIRMYSMYSILQARHDAMVHRLHRVEV